MDKLLSKLATIFSHRNGKDDSVITGTKMMGLLELSKKQQDEQRKSRRRKLILRSLPGVIVIFVIALWFLLPTPLTYIAIRQYNSKHYGVARAVITPLTWTSPEPFVAAFNSGTIDTRLAKYDRAQAELKHALDIAPNDKKCMVVQNLVFALNAHAKSLDNDGAAKKLSDHSSDYKNKYPNCFRAMVSNMNGGGGGGGGGGGSNSGASLGALGAGQAQKLGEKNEEGQASQQPDINQLIKDANSPSTKPW